MNINLEKLNMIYSLLNDLINIDLKNNNKILSQIIKLFNDIVMYIEFLSKEFYFTNIIEFELKKNKIIHKLILIKNIFINCNLNTNTVIKIDNIISISKTIMYPAYLNLNNISKYSNEIKKNSIKFYYKPNTSDIKNYFYDEEYESEELNEYDEPKLIELNKEQSKNLVKVTKIKQNKQNKQNNKKLQNNKNHVINNLKGINFINNIDYTNSFIII